VLHSGIEIVPLEPLYRRLVPQHAPIALLDFPLYPNVGDSAIWLGATALAARNGNRVRYTATHASYNARALARELPAGGVIVVQGGGNFGDRWPAHHRLRERVVADFAGHKVVFLPVSVEFLGDGAAERSFALLGAHPDLTVMCRDECSFAEVDGHLPGRAALTTDSAVALGRLIAPSTPERSRIVALLRTDSEAQTAVAPAPPELEVRVTDWLNAPGDEGHDAAFERAKRVLQRSGSVLVRTAGIAPKGHQALLLRAYQAMARRRLLWGLTNLASGGIVVTDRLHGHILCDLMGKPHVVADSGHGKIDGYIATHGHSGATRLVPVDEVWDAARDLSLAAPAAG
jgi:exopolysaccharide biosynthesis predicted pyruvyltransferase EpsI